MFRFVAAAPNYARSCRPFSRAMKASRTSLLVRMPTILAPSTDWHAANPFPTHHDSRIDHGTVRNQGDYVVSHHGFNGNFLRRL